MEQRTYDALFVFIAHRVIRTREDGLPYFQITYMPDLSSLKNRNPALYEALKLFTAEALQIMGKAVNDGARVPEFFEFSWKRKEGEDLFVRRQTSRPDYWILVHQLRKSIESLATYHQARAAVQADQLWSSHVDKLVGSPMNARRIDLDGVLKQIPTHILRETRHFYLSEQHFNEQVNEFERMVASPTIEYVRTTPLYGITLQEKISFSDAVSFEPLTDDKVLTFLDLGLITSNFFGAGGDFVHNPPRTAVVTRFMMPKVVRGDHDAPDAPNPSYMELWSRHAVVETTAIELLTLIQGEAITPIGSVTESQGITGGSRQFQKNAISNSFALTSIALTPEAKEKFCQLWPIVSDDSKKSKHFLAIAIRRFALAMSRPSLDDKLIDQMICAEALFLRVENNELTYKLAHRAALLLGDNPSHQKEIFDFFKNAYSMRSKVVHGNKSYANDPKDIERLTQTINRLSEHLRTSILKMLAIAMNPRASSELINWTELMFPEITSREEKASLG